MLYKKNLISFLVFYMVILSGCSSSDLENVIDNIKDQIEEIIDPKDSLTKTGIFTDSAVEGLVYECSSGITGVTNNRGQFSCDKNNTISFFLGGNILGESELLDYITPYTLFKDNNISALNLAQLLQSLDSDQNLSNGIKIEEYFLSKLGNELDFSSISFEEDINDIFGSQRSLISENIALAHMELEFIKLNINRDGSSPRITDGIVKNIAPLLTINTIQNAIENQLLAFQITALDVNSDVLTYSINGTDSEYFNIDASNGIVTFKQEADFEKKNIYNLTIHASDGALSDSKNIILNIINIGESIPILANTVLAVPENALEYSTVGNIIIQFIGDDNISAIVLSGNGNENFHVDLNGLITIAASAQLDFETKNIYNLQVVAKNSAGFSSSVNVDITVTNVGEQKIVSAVYNDQRTETVSDDILYLYMNESIDETSFNADRSLNYDINGSGVLNSDIVSTYNDSIFYRDMISMTSGSTKFIEGIDNIIIKIGQITDIAGATAIGKTTTTIETFNVFALLSTGQTVSEVNNDDGYYKKSLIRNYSLDGVLNETVIDNLTNLTWQKEDDNVLRTLNEAQDYCAELTLNGNADFRLPTIQELLSITDKGRFNPAIDPLFLNTKNSSNYWSSTLDINNDSNVWFVFFYAGHGLSGNKTSLNYVRCVY